MEDKKKNAPREGGYKEGGQRISVRPGNFAPPAAAPAAGAKPAAEGSKENAPREGGGNNNRHGRNRRGNNRHGRDRRDNQGGERREQQNHPQQEAKPRQEAPKENNRRDKEGQRGRNHNNRRDRERPQSAPISESLKRELEAEFDSSAFSSFAPKSKETGNETAVDTSEFEVDIATAAYLTEDIPCGFPAPDGKSVEVIGVRFRQAGKVYFFAPAGEKFRIGEAAIVDTARGPEYGEVVMLNRHIAERDVIQPLRAVLRRATKEDRERYESNREKEAEALKICAEKIARHKLDMKLVEAQYTFDNSKLLFYFTSDGRVDFRELVRDLAGVFRTRIELRQIGIRDESRLIGGLGMCGRPFCCTTFLSDFGQVSVKMAKEQGLSINTSKISGCCGRLMCCLRYEHETYAAEAALTPQKDARVETPDGPGTVTESTPLAGTVKVRLDKAPEEPPVTYHRDTLKSLTPSAHCPKVEPAVEAPEEASVEETAEES
ncbi:MAG: hypothetical protein E7644_07590 [Ruminococcaceae bacterium]|nr:hypothetical protein [Oscillospiraceae bacterium]